MGASCCRSYELLRMGERLNIVDVQPKKTGGQKLVVWVELPLKRVETS